MNVELFKMKHKLAIFSFILILVSVPAYSSDRSDLIREYLDAIGMIKGLRGMYDMQAGITLKTIS